MPWLSYETKLSGTVRHSKSQVRTLSAYSHSVVMVLPSRHSSCNQFSASLRNACRQMTRRRVSAASGTEAGTASKTRLKLRALSFRFLSQRALRMAPADSIAPQAPASKLNCPLANKPPATTTSKLSEAACSPFAKPQVAGLHHRRAGEWSWVACL